MKVRSIIKWVRVITLWVSVKGNRSIGMSYIKKAVEVLEMASKFTETDKDDKFIEKSKEKMAEILQELPEEFAEKLICFINCKCKGPLKSVKINYDKKG
jgi:hypothetical protein